MRAVIQRVTKASASVNGQLISEINKGLCVLVGIHKDDTDEDMEYVIRKILSLRLFAGITNNTASNDSNAMEKITKDLKSTSIAESRTEQPNNKTTCDGTTESNNASSADKVASNPDLDANNNRWILNVQQASGQVLLLSQFTLYANVSKGAKPDFHNSMKPDQARRLFEQLVQKTRQRYQAIQKDINSNKNDATVGEENSHPWVKCGKFQEYSQIEIHNDGPLTILVDSKNRE